MDSERKGDWIQTYTGRRFWPLDPRPEDVAIEDIAHALSNLCRFTGHCKTFYSVAQHSVIAAEQAKPGVKLLALLHDAAEAYMGDIARPWKRFLHVKIADCPYLLTLKQSEKLLLDTILNTFEVVRAETDWAEVSRVDELLLVTEARDFMGPLSRYWHHSPDNGFEILPDEIKPISPGASRYQFLKTFNELTGK